MSAKREPQPNDYEIDVKTVQNGKSRNGSSTKIQFQEDKGVTAPPCL